MRITVRVGLEPDACAMLRGDPELESLLAPALRISPFPWVTADVESAAFDRIVATSRRGPALRYTPTVEFNEEEVEQASWLELQGGKSLVESETDHLHNDTRRAAAPWVRTGPRHAHRVLRDLSLARVRLRPRQVANVEEWIEEWVTPTSIVHLLESAGLVGFTTRPLLVAAHGRAQEGYVQLDTTHVMPPMRQGPGLVIEGRLAEDPLVPAMDGETPDLPAPPDAMKYRLSGCLVYLASDALPASDFARTAEALGPWGQPMWVVSGRVREVLARHKIRGCRFAPLLADGSEAHAEYLRRWRAFEEKVAVNAANRLW